MAGVSGSNGFNASPNSSEELESGHATPATKTSLFSPQEVREILKPSNTGIVRSKVPPAFVLTQAQPTPTQQLQVCTGQDGVTQDPFISRPTLSATTQSSTDTSKLSPIASTFTPQNLLASSTASSVILSEPTGSTTLSPQRLRDLQSKLAGLAAPPGLSHLPDLHPSTLQKLSYKPEDGKAAFAIGDLRLDRSSQPEYSKDVWHGSFSTDRGTSRYLLISKVAHDCSVAAIEAFFSPGIFGSIKNIIFTDLVTASAVYVQFGDIRDVVRATTTIDKSPRAWSVQLMSPQAFAVKAYPGSTQSLLRSDYEAQVLVTATSINPQQALQADKTLGDLVRGILSHAGDLMAFARFHPAQSKGVIYRAEFCSTDAADRLLANGNLIEIDHCMLSMKRYEPDLDITSPHSSKRAGPLIIGEDETGLTNALQSMSLNGSCTNARKDIIRSVSFPSFMGSTPTGRSLTSRKDVVGQHTPSSLTNSFSSLDYSSGQTSPFWSPNLPDFCGPPSIWSSNSPGAVGQERGAVPSPSHSTFYQHHLGNGTCDPEQQRSLHKGARRHTEHNIGTHNVVDVSRIRFGLDVRTTIMLRNIPNKMTSAVLKGILDETSFGKYDFTYLRIDFANNCNVGYAFINFEDPIHIVNFVNARAGRRWNCYSSDKVAEISYATIQGRDCLVQKFRNSSVMLEQPSSRPKIWSTSGATIGQEESFPGPDNPSKMRRSVENAEHVGLFAPRAGQNFRDEERRRRSQYDRGTRFAELEDSYGPSADQYRVSPGFTGGNFPRASSYQQQVEQMYFSRFQGSC